MRAALEVAGVSCRFPLGRGRFVQAVDDVTFEVGEGEALGLVGESGCGKSTLARLVNRLAELDSGGIRLHGVDIGVVPPGRFAGHASRGALQMVFQDAGDSLDPRLTAGAAIGAPLHGLSRLDRAGIAARVEVVAGLAGLPVALLSRYPHQLSGGQKARVGIARALAPSPRVLVLDEPTAALDVSVQAVVLRLFDDLRRQLGLSLLFISHDLSVVRLLCDRVAVMLLGQVVETGPAGAVFADPRHPYTRSLVDAVPDPARRGRPIPAEWDPSLVIPPDACRFVARCPLATERCRAERPVLRDGRGGRSVACHHMTVE